MPTEALGRTLLLIARNAIGEHLGRTALAVAESPELLEAGATFVTLMQGAQLRGCMGSLEAHRPLVQDVAHNALAAAFRDPRFPPLPPGEFLSTRIEVSLLSAPEDFPVTDEQDCLAKLRPGIDGLILTHGMHRATFLPQVWESLPAPDDFLRQLKLKAGLPADFWDEDLRLARYGVWKWKEN